MGFAERGLKSWVKQPARTAQKQSGGIFEKLVNSRMHEHTMMEKVMLHMSEESVDADSMGSEDEGTAQRLESNGSCFHIQISRENH